MNESSNVTILGSVALGRDGRKLPAAIGLAVCVAILLVVAVAVVWAVVISTEGVGGSIVR